MDTKKSFNVLNDKSINKSLSFNRSERDKLGLRGLLPYTIENQETQVARTMQGIRRKAHDIEKYIMLSILQDRDEHLFYQTTIENIEEIMPLIYTPTVGEACVEFSHIFREAKGFYITRKDKCQIESILDNWPEKDIRVIVITDGQRILGLGDLGANGMGIPIGKLALYVACAGIQPQHTLPVVFDVGTNNQTLLDDPFYIGYPEKRLEGEAYFELMEEFVLAVQKKYPKALIQFEDFLTPNAFALLKKYRNRVLCFNDDIQGTAAVVLSGVFSSERITKRPFAKTKIMFLGAGSAATGIADLMVTAFMDEGLSREDAIKQLWFVDSKGLVVASRDNLKPHNLPYAHNFDQMSFVEAIDAVKPHVLIGATGMPGTFTKEVIEHISAINERPAIFALSNPTSRAESTAIDTYNWSKGKAIFSSGSPFAKVEYNGKMLKPGQGNNAYIFPGMGLGAIICEAKSMPDELFLVASRTLAKLVSENDIEQGSLFPSLKEIRNISVEIAVAVAEKAFEMNITKKDKPENLRQIISDYIYNPKY